MCTFDLHLGYHSKRSNQSRRVQVEYTYLIYSGVLNAEEDSEGNANVRSASA